MFSKESTKMVNGQLCRQSSASRSPSIDLCPDSSKWSVNAGESYTREGKFLQLTRDRGQEVGLETHWVLRFG